MPKQETPNFNWANVQKALDDLPPKIRERIEIPLRSSNPRMFLSTLRTLRDQLDAAIKKLEEATGDNPGADTGTRGE